MHPLNKDFWQQLNHPLVRDLAWCLYSPSLVLPGSATRGLPLHPPDIRINEIQPNNLDQELLVRLDQNSAPLVSWQQSAAGGTRLGRRFECYWQYWLLQRYPDWQHRFNIQVCNYGKTLGEMDNVSFDPREGRLIHREMAVKFYLGMSDEIDGNRPMQWLGPNSNDRFDLKLTRLYQSQMRLLDLPAAQSCLPESWNWTQLDRELVIKGRLYYPLSEGSEIITGQSNYWCHQKQLASVIEKLGALGSFAWLPLHRFQWLAPLQWPRHQTSNLLEPGQLLARFGAQFNTNQESVSRPTQLAAYRSIATTWQEEMRLFVVPDHWPTSGIPARST